MKRTASGREDGRGSRGHRIFLNYRRQDTAGHAGWLYESLRSHFSREQVFKDIDNLRPGEDFVEKLQGALERCRVLLVMIGERWLTVTDSEGRRRLDDPADFVRVEIAAALDRGIPVIPVLVQGAGMPSSAQLPEPLRRLSRRQAIGLTDERWGFDVARLIRAVEDLDRKGVEATATDGGTPASAAPSVPETAAVLSSDVLGTTGLAERLSPEDFMRVLGRFMDEMRGAVERHKGEVVRALGDQILAVFRAPEVQAEQRPRREARRAVQAALRIRAVHEALNAELDPRSEEIVAVRTAVHAGQAPADDDAGVPPLMSDAMNVVARLASASAPGAILLSDAIRELLGDEVTVQRFEDVESRGRTEPIATWLLTSEKLE